MLTRKTSPVLVLAIGVGLMLASLVAVVIGTANGPGLGLQQTTTIMGIIITAVGLYLVLKAE